MPELPEVETIKNDLSPRITGRRFTGARFFWEPMVTRPSAEELTERLQGREIKEVTRRGKYLILRLSGGEALVLHLRMSGSLLLLEKGVPSSDHDRFIRAVFYLDGMELRFSDKRKLGKVALVGDEKEIVGKLGPEPLEPGFTAEVLAQRLRRHKSPIKAVLCDQQVVAGIGNMYADEALFLSRIHPLKKADSLSANEVSCLHKAICQVLRDAIANGGASISDYFRPGGEQGNHQYTFKVAHRRGQVCYVCRTPIQRIAVRNRGTYFCPKCQAVCP